MSTALLPFFISTIKKVKLTGVLVFGGLVLSHFIRKEVVASVWCFFAAISSLYIVYETYQERVKNSNTRLRKVVLEAFA